MAYNPNSRDPRLALRNQMYQAQSSTNRKQDTYKRTASQSPPAWDRPPQKLAKPGSAISSRQPSHSSNDVRQPNSNSASPVGSRRGSTQMNGSRPTPQAVQKPAGFDTANSAWAKPDSAISSADLSSKQNDAFAALTASNNHAAELASVRTFHSQAKAQVDKATREFTAMSRHFQEFPAMKESHTQAKKKAEDNFRSWDEKLQRLDRSQQPLLANIVRLIVHQNNAASPEPSNTDFVSRIECERLISEAVAECKQHFDTNYGNRITDVEKRTNAIPTETPTIEHVSSLDERITALEAPIRGIQDNAKQRPDAGVERRLQILETGLTDIKDGLPKDVTNDLLQRVESIENSVQALKVSQSSIREQVEKSDSSQKKTRKDLDDMHSVIADYVEARLQNHSDNVKNEVQVVKNAHDNETRATRETIDGLREDVDKGNKGQQQNREAIDECSKRVGKVEERLATKDDLSAVKRKAADESALGSANTDTNGFMQFQPILPETAEEESLPRLQKIESDVMMVQTILQQHKRILDNTITDQVAQQMLDQLSVQFPHAKNFQAAVEGVHGHLSNLTSNLNALSQRVHNLETGLANAGVDNLRTDHEKLSAQVSQHQELISRGEQQVGAFSGDFKAIRKDILTLQALCDTLTKSLFGDSGKTN